MSTMNGQREDSLKRLLDQVPQGFLIDSAWLNSNGISRQSAHQYTQNGWLESLGRGLFRRPFSADIRPDVLKDWKIPVLSMQWLMGHRVHVGGKSALQLAGVTHYLSFGGNDQLYLYGKLPTWFERLDLNARLCLRPASLFTDLDLGVDNTDFSLASGEGQSLALSPWTWPMRISSPERAILEMIDELPAEESFHNIDTLFQSLSNLRPRKLSRLLQDCRSVKVKRLFLVFAERHGHAWRKHLDLANVDLGSGDRSVVKGGRLHPIYRVMVPPEFVPGHKDENIGA
ncbi:type IV toxin-antitoxin system AbiEi family antitoxin domain-containing protein [Rhizobium beringeri]|nr:MULTISPECIES: type IV toxin-antitoxin system AbiEi family antitoxin domain-containing protein [Rhizobium]WSG75201.1 type IV toxin-antitoxin system AbiEi family antitoxin domain-containing protein [Rhizobium beringeri]WSH15396.1 type IV toxin-antitoxin system AbiEi family antitoxin domain-containing protein [Rhizobium beringeri]WSH52106.1 type IV toxin-antitoxin system AbiEi family antitoxin domain-containing protein [Rhizobium beringeri]